MGPYGSVGAHIKTGWSPMAHDHFWTPPDPQRGHKNLKLTKKLFFFSRGGHHQAIHPVWGHVLVSFHMRQCPFIWATTRLTCWWLGEASVKLEEWVKTLGHAGKLVKGPKPGE